jgi:plastocyanin
MRSTYLGALVAAIFAISACGGGTSPSSTPATAPPNASPSPAVSGPTGSAPSGEAVQITIGTDTGTELRFDPAEPTVQAGADVRVTFENRASVPHNLTFQAPIDVATETAVAPGTSDTAEFTAPAPGEYAFVCTLHPGMGGKLIVTAGPP